MSKRTMLFMVAAALLLFSGCTRRLIDFTIISTKNIDWSKAESFKQGNSRAQGEDITHIIIFIPTGVPNVKTAIDKAIESVPGAVALVDGVLSLESWWIPYIYGRQSYIVEGSPLINQKELGAAKNGAYFVSYMHEDGELKMTKTVSREEYESIKKEYM